MSKSDPIETALDRLGEMRHLAPDRSVIEEIRKYLAHRSNLVVAKAAALACQMGDAGLIADLVSAFHRFMSNPKQNDKRCAATTEIVKTLYQFDYVEPDIYLQGLRHVQLEPSFGPPVDTAAILRGTSAQGLLRTRHPHAMTDVLPLLLDPEPAARIGAVKAFAANGGAAGVLVLRFKVLAGDSESEVLLECFAGLLSAAPEQSVEFVAAYMDAEDVAVAEAAIWALGQARLKSGFDCLREKWNRSASRPMQKVLLAAMAASRREEAAQFLYSLIAEENSPHAADALEALSTYQSEETIRQAVSRVSRTAPSK